MAAWEPIGRGDETAARLAAYRAADEAEKAVARTQELEQRLDRLALVSQALWTLLAEKVGLTEAALLARIDAVDLSDGVRDGKARPTTAPCPSCSRPVASNRARCIYCGKPVLQTPFPV